MKLANVMVQFGVRRTAALEVNSAAVTMEVVASRWAGGGLTTGAIPSVVAILTAMIPPITAASIEGGATPARVATTASSIAMRATGHSLP